MNSVLGSREKSDDDHLLKQFRAFFDEVSKAQSRAIEMRETDPDKAAQAISKHLESLIELQTLESQRLGNRFELEGIADSRYLKAALADEILLNTQWVGRDCWTAHLLEASMFRTSVAGERIFERIEALLSNREPSRRSLAGLYLCALALGFQGRYRGSPDDGRLAGLRDELFQFIYQRRADLSGRDRVLTGRAYASTLSHIEPKKVRTLSRWGVGFVLALAGLLAISEIVWLSESWPVRNALHAAGRNVTAGVMK